MNYSVTDFAIEDEDPFAAVFDSKTLTDRGGGELGEILWEKGPVFRRFPSPDCEVSIGEEEVIGWLRFSPEKGGEKGPVGPPEGKEAMASMVGSNVMSELGGLPPESRISWSAGTSGPWSNFSGELTLSSFGGSRDDVRKRKGRDSDDTDAEDADYDTDNKKKENRRLTRKARATEVHNLSERRRRDRINEKMKALQQLIPRCNKSDKASMLEDAVEYVKSLQYQIQMMCMGCAMPPMIYPGIPQYAHPMGMVMDTALGCLTHPMLPFTTVVQASPISAATTAHIGAGVPIQNFHPTAALDVRDQPRGMGC